MRRVLSFSLLCGLALAACRRPGPDQRVDGWKYVRAALTDGKECFAGRPEYCITDPEFIDAAVQPRLKALYDGEMPERDIKVWALARAAAREYRRMLTKPDSVARVEELVRERYRSPVVTTDAATVHVDVGVIPGKIVAAGASHTLRIAASDDEVDGLWSATEARRVLHEYASRYPDKPDVEVKVTIGVMGVLDRLTYRYKRDARRILILSEEGEAWTTEPLRDGLEGIEAAPLQRAELLPCRAPRGASPLDVCEPIPKEADGH